MLTIPYTDRDYSTVFEDIKEIMQTLEPRADININKANVETIIAKIIAGCVDSLSYNQDANILEAFPSTAKNPRSVFDLLSIVGYTPRTARCCHVIMTLWNPNFSGTAVYEPFSKILIDGKTFYSPDKFKCTQDLTTVVNWYQGSLKQPDRRREYAENASFIDKFYPNLSVNVIENNQYKLPEAHTKIDSKTVRVYFEDGKQLEYVDNPYMTNITKSSFSLIPSVNQSGYSLVFSKDVSAGTYSKNLYYFYVVSEGYNVGNNLIPDFSGLAIDNVTPTFSYSYNAEDSKDTETANEARENIVYEFGWRDTPKAIVTKYDAERAVLQNYNYIAAVDVRDGNDYSKCDPSNFDIQVFCKVNEDTELRLSTAVADGIKNRLQTHFNKFKMLPLQFSFHIDNIVTEENENTTELYYWYPDITIYLKEQVNAQEAAAITNSVTEALFKRFATTNMEYNQVPRIVDVIETVQNASDMILYLDIDGIYYIDSENKEATKTDITCSFIQTIPTQEGLDYELILNTKNGTRNIMFNTVKIVNNLNETIAYDNGDGVLMSYSNYFNGQGTINYTTGKLTFKLRAPLADNISLQLSYKLETPTFCEFINKKDAIKVALESLKA